MFRRFFLGYLLVFGLGAYTASSASAQGLIWKAPDEGTWVRYEGDYSQFDDRPNDPVDKRLKLGPWRRHLTLKALKKTQAEYEGQTVDCQWFEIKVITASEKGGDGTLKPGPGGQRIYKVLVPIAGITGPPVEGRVIDKDTIPVAFLPVVKGYRRFGERPVEPITSGVLQTYPMISLLAYYRTLEVAGEGEDSPSQTSVGDHRDALQGRVDDGKPHQSFGQQSRHLDQRPGSVRPRPLEGRSGSPRERRQRFARRLPVHLHLQRGHENPRARHRSDERPGGRVVSAGAFSTLVPKLRRATQIHSETVALWMRCEAELRVSAFPSRAWERGKGTGMTSDLAEDNLLPSHAGLRMEDRG